MIFVETRIETYNLLESFSVFAEAAEIRFSFSATKMYVIIVLGKFSRTCPEKTVYESTKSKGKECGFFGSAVVVKNFPYECKSGLRLEFWRKKKDEEVRFNVSRMMRV